LILPVLASRINNGIVFHQPATIAEAVSLKQTLGEHARFVAGGTDIVVLMNHGRFRPEHIIDLTHIPSLFSVRRSNGRYELGGNVSFSRCAALPVPCLAGAALSVGGPGIRNMGTLAGNLASASPAADGATALLALEAELELTGPRGRRRLPIDRFFLDYRKTALAQDELITRIRIPSSWQSVWAKTGKRAAVNISVVAAAVARPPGGSPRIALASVAPTPIRCSRAEEFLESEGTSAPAIREAAALAAAETRPVSDHRASAEYRRHIAGVLVRRLLEELCLP
jgi:CO/xanthine dehydrogenase FAD-binding subunit